MTSKIKVDNINKVSDDSNIINKCGTNITMGQNGDTVIIPNGVTEQVQSGGAIQVQSGGSITIASGATITNNGTAVGLGRTGTVDWATTPVTATFIAANGVGYFCNTTVSGFTVNLPAGVAGAIVSLADYASTFATHNLTVSPNGSEKIGGNAIDVSLSTNGQSVTLVYVDATEGWVTTSDSSENILGSEFICASVSGACNTLATAPCCANVKIATFTGPGNFIVNAKAQCAANNVVSYMIVAGGGGGAARAAGGGGAGGYREVKSPSATGYTASPLDGYATPANRITVPSAGSYPVVVGGGGAGGGPPCCEALGAQGGTSSFLGIASAGGGPGNGSAGNPGPDANGGSGGGTGPTNNGGSGNTPPVSPPQGNNGGTGAVDYNGAGGGGAGGVGANSSPSGGGAGGAVTTSSISASPTAYAGGGGGSSFYVTNGGPGGAGTPTSGAGGPGTSTTGAKGGNGVVNTGGGAGAGSTGPANTACGCGGVGGSGIVIIRYKFQ